MADSTGVAPESPRLHGIAFGAWDSARKVLNLIEQHLGLDLSKHETPNEIEDMMHGGVELLTRILAHLDTRGADLAEAVKDELVELAPERVEALVEEAVSAAEEHLEPAVEEVVIPEAVSAAESVVHAAERVIGKSHR